MSDTLSPGKAAALFVVVVLAWGTTWPVTKLLVQSVPPLWVTATRSAVALVGLLAILRLSGNLIVPKRGDIPVVLSVSILHMTLFTTFVATGLQFIPASKGVVLGYTTPLWVALATLATKQERLGPRKIAGVVLGLLGLGLILNPASLDWTRFNVIFGAGAILLAAACWAANIIYIRSHRWIATPLQLVVWQVLVATVVLSSMALVREGWPHIAWSPRLVFLFLYGGLVGTALAHWAMSMVNKSLPALTTSLGTTATPVVGIVTAAVTLGETIDPALAAAVAFIIAGIVLSTLADAADAGDQRTGLSPTGTGGLTRSAPRRPAALPARMPPTATKEASASVDNPVSPCPIEQP